MRGTLRGVADVDRITARIALRSARPRDLSALRESLLRLPELASALAPCRAPLLVEILGALAIAPEPLALLQQAIAAEPAAIPAAPSALRMDYAPEPVEAE